MNSEKLWTRNFISISASTLFLFLTFYCLLVILPLYALEDLHGQATDAGLVVTVFLLAAILIRPIAGQWLGRIEKRSLLLLSLCLFLIADLFISLCIL
ncbi:MFS transporter [Ectobacillus funiculus]